MSKGSTGRVALAQRNPPFSLIFLVGYAALTPPYDFLHNNRLAMIYQLIKIAAALSIKKSPLAFFHFLPYVMVCKFLTGLIDDNKCTPCLYTRANG